MQHKGADNYHHARLLYIGIFCRKEDLAARLLIRETMMQAVPRGVTIHFIVCHPSSQEMDPVMWAELRQTTTYTSWTARRT